MLGAILSPFMSQDEQRRRQMGIYGSALSAQPVAVQRILPAPQAAPPARTPEQWQQVWLSHPQIRSTERPADPTWAQLWDLWKSPVFRKLPVQAQQYMINNLHRSHTEGEAGHEAPDVPQDMQGQQDMMEMERDLDWRMRPTPGGDVA
jgi:hypothetical protein